MQATTQLSQFSKLRTLVIGDIMLDRFIYGAVERLSPESPAPLLTIKETRSMLGGAGNVVRNLVALGAEVSLHTVVGDDAVGREIIALAGNEDRLTAHIVTEQQRPSTLKVRYVADSQQLLRADHETKRPIAQSSNRRMLASLCGEFEKHDAVVLSDYKKGVLSTQMIRLIINFAREHKRPVIIDPKARTMEDYRGATVLTPNLSELSRLALLSNCPLIDIETDEEILEAALWLAKEFDIEHMLITRGKDGMTLASKGGGYLHLAARAHQITDVSGAGDTVVATFALALAAGMTPEEAAKLANTAAGIAVERLGTSVVSQLDLQLSLISQRRIGGMHKIMTLDSARDVVQRWKREGRVVGFANGCFDLFHGGHQQLINRSRECCDRLVVAINSDVSTRTLKGETRPIQDQHERAMILAGQESVDLVIIFNEATPIKAIEQLVPDRLFKGSDYKAEDVVGASIVRDNGGETVILPRSNMNSTGEIIRKVRESSNGLALVVSNHQQGVSV